MELFSANTDTMYSGQSSGASRGSPLPSKSTNFFGFLISLTISFNDKLFSFKTHFWGCHRNLQHLSVKHKRNKSIFFSLLSVVCMLQFYLHAVLLPNYGKHDIMPSGKIKDDRTEYTILRKKMLERSTPKC